MDLRVIKLQLSRTYLLMAKVVANGMRDIPSQGDDEQFSIIFAIRAGVVLYSYMAVEAFVTKTLFNVWSRGTRTDETSKLIYSKFMERYKSVSQFRYLKARGNARNSLLYKMDAICHSFGYPTLKETDNKVWQDFSELLKEYRHFLVHPDPIHFSEKIFNMSKISIEEYPQIAGKVLEFFYRQGGQKIPDWVSSNKATLFQGKFIVSD